MILSFREFVYLREEATGSEAKPEQEKSNYVDSIWQELGIPIEAFENGTTITAPLDLLREKNILFNQTMWTVPKQDIDQNSRYIKIQYFDANQSNPKFTRAYYKNEKGKLVPYLGKIPDGTEFFVTANKFAEMLGMPFKAAAVAAAAGAGGALPGGLPGGM